MRVITENPANVIPDIMENDINDKVMVVHFKSNESNVEHIGYITRIGNDVSYDNKIHIHFNGGINDSSRGRCINWYDIYSNTLNLICKLWNNSSRNTVLYVLESHTDLRDLLKIIDIRNNDVLTRIQAEATLKFGNDKNTSGCV